MRVSPPAPRRDAGARSAPPQSARRSKTWVGVTMALALSWAGATTGYILFRDEIAQALFAQQTEMRFVYEARIADLKARLEREVTANMVERRNVGARLASAVSRQGEIEARQAWLARVTERLGGPRLGTDHVRRPVPAREPEVSDGLTTGSISGGRPSPVPTPPLDLTLRPGKDAALPPPEAARLSAVEDSLRRVAERALDGAEIVRRHVRDRTAKLRSALDATRLDVSRAPVEDAPMGGPLVPLPSGFDAASFDPIALDAEASLATFERLAEIARALPLARPLTGALDPTSGFGYRVDPFTRGLALHTGVDFRAEAGSPVIATGAGRVTVAEVTGGYGKMVEVEHEGGVSTRYGHLSAITVVPGQAIAAGQMVGRAGSTGRSTGSHLHYETRVRGEPVNPGRFLEAGQVLASGDP